MVAPGGSRRKKPWMTPGDGTDHITALPLDLRARIASLLPFRQVARLSSLSRPWRHIHHHTPVVSLKLDDFLFLTEEMLDEDDSAPGVLDEDALAALEAALLRRAEEGSGFPKVGALRISYSPDDPRMMRHAGRIMAAAGAREVRVSVPNDGGAAGDAWPLDLPPASRDLDVVAFRHLAPTIAGPGAATSLETLRLEHVVLREWPCLPALRSLTLDTVTVEAPFPPGASFPRLEHLCISVSEVEQVRLDIRLPLLESLEMDDVYGSPGDVTVDAPALKELDVSCAIGCDVDYRSFTLRAPRLRCLRWRNQFAERVDIDVGRPGSVVEGTIQFKWNGGFDCREMKDCQAQMMRMLQGLMPELPSERVADAARPYTTLKKYTVKGFDDGELLPEEKLICDIHGLMSSLHA
ncbi:hypothetical protein ACP70R_022719 [Stipagrostis hirtigluma subsp. patula]